MKRYVIIGTGVAGISAAEAIRTQDTSGKITLIGDEPDIYYSRPGLAYVLSGEVPEAQLYPFTAEDFTRLKVALITDRVTKIDRDSSTVSLRKGGSFPYDRLLIAIGAEARQARVPGSQLPGVVKLDNFSDARRIIHLAKSARRAVVVGGGITALEIVEGLSAQGVKVHYFLRGDRYWSNVLDETESKIVEHRLIEEGVKIHYHTEIEEILGKAGGLLGRGEKRVSAVRTTNGETISCEIVAIAIGISPRIGLAKEAGLALDRGILVSEFMETSVQNIYAAGDVAQTLDHVTGKHILDSLWGPARDQGWTAGMNMAGTPTVYRKAIPFNVTRLAGLTTTIIGSVGGRAPDDDTVGIVRGDSEGWREIPDAIASQSDFDVNRIRVLVGERTLLGAIVMGDQTLSSPIHLLVADQVDITPIRSRLLLSDGQVGEVIAGFWKQMNGQGPGYVRP